MSILNLKNPLKYVFSVPEQHRWAEGGQFTDSSCLLFGSSYSLSRFGCISFSATLIFMKFRSLFLYYLALFCRDFPAQTEVDLSFQ